MKKVKKKVPDGRKFSCQRNFHKYQIKGIMSIIQIQLNHREVPPCELERVLLTQAHDALKQMITNWENSTRLIKSFLP